ncbi:MAG: type 1 glutamine amidotransferase [Actinomycetota bacterium]
MGPVVVVQHQPSVPPGSITDVLEGSGIDHIVFHAWSQDDWPTTDDLSAVVVLGGTMNVDQIDAYPFIGRSISFMSDALKQGVPTLGVCLGSQMMAKVLGQPVYRAEPRNALFSPLEPTPEALKDPVITPFSSGVHVLQFHEDTYDVPPEAVALATSTATGLTQAFRYGDSAYGIQFHFEVDDAILRGWCRTIGAQALREEWGVSEEDLVGQATEYMAAQNAAGKELFARFLALGLH